MKLLNLTKKTLDEITRILRLSLLSLADLRNRNDARLLLHSHAQYGEEAQAGLIPTALLSRQLSLQECTNLPIPLLSSTLTTFLKVEPYEDLLQGDLPSLLPTVKPSPSKHPPS